LKPPSRSVGFLARLAGMFAAPPKRALAGVKALRRGRRKNDRFFLFRNGNIC
jgi:hypothetical protein